MNKVLDIKKDRKDYSTLLEAPSGYKFDTAVITTYSLDLDALLSIMISLGGYSKEIEDSKSLNNLVAMLSLLRNMSSRISVYCEAG